MLLSSCPFRLLTACLAVLLCTACGGRQPAPLPSAADKPVVIEPATHAGIFPVHEEEVKRLCGLLSAGRQKLASWNDMAFAVEQSLAYVRCQPQEQVLFHAWDRPVSYGDMAEALTRFKALLPHLDAEPELLASAFTWYRVGPDFGFTGYYEPELAASPVRTNRFRHPLYAKPPELSRKNRRKAFHTRHAIDRKGALAGRGLEIAWTDDPVEVFILHIQGSGRLRYADGRVRHALYAGQNGRKYVSLGRIMRERGHLPADGISMDSIRDWLARHPAERDALLDTNPSYVFFRLSDEPSQGSMGRPLTPWVSVATDQKALPNGCLAFMSVDLPAEQGKSVSFHALTLPQDKGGAIRGHRVDLFCGHGPEAERVAGNLNARGAVFVLLPRYVLPSGA